MNILTKLLTSTGEGLITSIGTVLDDLITSKEEKQLVQVELEKIISKNYISEKELLIKELEFWANDMESAREADVERAVKSNSWLQKNIVPLLAIFWTIITVSVMVLVLLGTLVATEALVILIVNGLFNVVMLIIGFYFGSSHGESKAIQDFKNTPTKIK